ncbi:GNAT family N-acetyltransferase [Streptacidiphilus sp. ASG 303]|uniref:GNAT family N-acetyltransferase n=1 Tax=Streptacidiphilus sp. ASG 303 TaxID=2896847 RepID=UPI001E3D9251|nr:GNAT family N-acetyltransferase [Streptacidiphilus sp. ASG 303]MCD0483808.1 GNAT family N-acetyltransferase [Streptacidiphilus sp. ASG 303]
MQTADSASPLAFRTAGLADVPAVVALVESAYRDEGAGGWTTEAHLLGGQRTDPQGVAEAVTAEGGRLLAVERDGELLACCLLERRGTSAYFGMFSVRPDRQGGGIGRAVLAEAERIARGEWGAAVMEMTVIVQREDLIAWYERRGYRRTGEILPFPYGDERFGVPRRPDLRFERLVKPLA